jgi:hypothetical protein
LGIFCWALCAVTASHLCLLSVSLCACLCVLTFPAVAAACAGTVATNTMVATYIMPYVQESEDDWQSAVCAGHPMAEGTHYVEMTLLETGYDCTHPLSTGYGAKEMSPQMGVVSPQMGVVGQGFDAAGGGRASCSAEGWMLSTGYGALRHDGRGSYWEGKPREYEIKQGDVVGLQLDLGQRTLSVYLNGARRGVMVAPGMKHAGGEVVAPLAGPLRWAVDVNAGASVRIEWPTIDEVD